MGKVGKIILGAGLIVAGVLLAPATGGASLALVNAGLSLAARNLFGPAAMASRANAIRQNVANPLADLPVVYGTAKVGLKLVDMRAGVSNPKKLYIVGAVCHGSTGGLGISGIGRIWFDEKLAFDAAGVCQSAFKKGGVDHATVTKYLGTATQAVDATMAAAFPSDWTTLHRGRGVAYCVFELLLHPDLYQGIPNITVEVMGAKVLDPRQASVTYAFSTNPALLVLDYLLSPIFGPRRGVGRRLPLAGSAVTNSGFTAFTAANVVDGNPATKGFDSHVTGDYVQFDFGRPVELDRVDVWMDLNVSPVETFEVQYADAAGGPYTTIPVSGGSPPGVLPLVERRNTFRWASHQTGTHRYWRLRQSNSPGGARAVMGVDWYETEIDYQSFVDEANAADVTVEVPPPESAFGLVAGMFQLNPLRLTKIGHGFSGGDRVHLALAPGVSASGLTDASGLIEGRSYTITVPDADHFQLTGIAASGIYTTNALRVGKLVTEATFRADGVLDTGQEPQENIRQLLASFRGRLIYQGGRFRCHSRKATATTVTFTDEDVRQIRWIVPGTKEKVNRVRVAFLNVERDWQPDQREYPRPGEANSYLTADNDFVSILDVDLPLVTSAYQADRIAQVLLRESRDGISVEMTVPERGLLAQVGDVAAFTLATPAWSAKPFWVENIGLSAEGEPVIALQEYEPNAYVLTDAQLHSSLPNTGLPDATAIPAAPTGLVLSAGDAEVFYQPTGEPVFRVKVAWTASVSPFVDYYEVVAKRSTESTYDTWGRPTRDDTLFFLAPVNVGEQWDVQVRAVTTLGVASDWVSGSVLVAPVVTPFPLGVVEYFDTYPGTRWTDTGNGGASTVRAAPDSAFGGKVLYCTASRTGEWIPYIPFDPTKLYAIRGRVRCLKGSNGSPPQDLFLGFMAYDNALQRLAGAGAGAGTNSDRYACAANFQVVAPGFGWTEFAGYIRGWAGSWYAPPAGVLTNSGFNGYTAANVGDGDPTTIAFHSDSATSGTTLTLDLGASVTKAFCRARVYLDAGAGVAQYKVQYSDNGSSWTDVTFRGGGVTWTPASAGWNEIDWGSATAHRYWRLLLNNTPGNGPNVMEWSLLEIVLASVNQGEAWDPDTPAQVCPGVMYIRPSFQTRGSTGQGYSVDCEWELDMIEMPPQAGSTALV